MLGKPLEHGPIHPKSDDGRIDSRLDARVNVAAADKRHQQVDRHRAVGGGVTHLADCFAQFGRRRQPERSESTRNCDGTRQLRARKATAHSSLGDGNVKAKLIQQVH
jgi:hypothetical protein